MVLPVRLCRSDYFRLKEIARLLDWMGQNPNAAAWVQALGAIFALAIAILIPWWQGRLDRRADEGNLRHALQVQVMVMAQEYLDEFTHWQKAGFAEDRPQMPQLPALTVFDANADKLGLLKNDEIIPLIWLAGDLHNLSVLVSAIKDDPSREARERI